MKTPNLIPIKFEVNTITKKGIISAFHTCSAKSYFQHYEKGTYHHNWQRVINRRYR